MADTPYFEIDATQKRHAYFKGQPVHEMTREELIDALVEMSEAHTAEVNRLYYRQREAIEMMTGERSDGENQSRPEPKLTLGQFAIIAAVYIAGVALVIYTCWQIKL